MEFTTHFDNFYHSHHAHCAFLLNNADVAVRACNVRSSALNAVSCKRSVNSRNETPYEEVEKTKYI